MDEPLRAKLRAIKCALQDSLAADGKWSAAMKGLANVARALDHKVDNGCKTWRRRGTALTPSTGGGHQEHLATCDLQAAGCLKTPGPSWHQCCAVPDIRVSLVLELLLRGDCRCNAGAGLPQVATNRKRRAMRQRDDYEAMQRNEPVRASPACHNNLATVHFSSIEEENDEQQDDVGGAWQDTHSGACARQN